MRFTPRLAVTSPAGHLPFKLDAMRFRRQPVRWLSSWLVVALLFMQLATATYACPRMAAPGLPFANTADMPGCDLPGARPADGPDSLLCHVHCQQAHQALDQSPTADLAATPLLLGVLDWAVPVSSGIADRVRGAPRAGVASGAPPPGTVPIYLRLLVLRN